MDPRARGLRPAAAIAAGKPHGTRVKYIGGCRCELCRKANSLYESARAKARRAGDWNGIVPADRARAHLKALARAGIGRRAVEAVSDVPNSILQEIKQGKRTRIRARTERKVLAVGKAQAADHSFVPARRTWALLGELLEEGYTRRQLLERLGLTKLQYRRTRVLVRTQARIERLHRELTT